MRKFLLLLTSFAGIGGGLTPSVISCGKDVDEDTKVLNLQHLITLFTNPLLELKDNDGKDLAVVTADQFQAALIVTLNNNRNHIAFAASDLEFKYFTDITGSTTTDFKANMETNKADNFIFYSVSAVKTSTTVSGTTGILKSSIYTTDYNPESDSL